MRPAFLIGWLAIPFIVACSSLGASDSGSDPDASQPGTDSGTVGTTCSAELNKCGWTALECSGDPACAHWYACVLDCNPSSGLQPCFDTCAAGQSLSANAAAVQKCLLEAHNGSCSTPVTAPDAAPDTSLDSQTDSPQGPYDSCDACLWALCQAQITACTTPGETPPDCLDYKHSFIECALSDSQTAFEKCLLQADKQASSAHADFSSFGAMDCVFNQCAALCLPPDYRDCAACSHKDCSEAWDAYLHNALAQNLAWCLDGCPSGNADCTANCKTSFGDAAGVLSSLVACQSQSCPTCH